MHYRLCLLAISLMALAACSTATTAPTATPVPPTAVPDTATTEPVQQVDTPVAVDSLPPVGEMITAAFEDPEEGLVFDLITFTRTGGASNSELTIELHGDGTLIRNGETSTVSQADVQAIDAILDELNFFNIEGIFAAAAANPDVYSYSITVDRNGSSRMINAQDTYTPVELKELFAAISNLGQQLGPAPGG